MFVFLRVLALKKEETPDLTVFWRSVSSRTFLHSRSIIPTQIGLNRFKADFLLRRGWFHIAGQRNARAFLSTG